MGNKKGKRMKENERTTRHSSKKTKSRNNTTQEKVNNTNKANKDPHFFAQFSGSLLCRVRTVGAAQHFWSFFF